MRPKKSPILVIVRTILMIKRIPCKPNIFMAKTLIAHSMVGLLPQEIRTFIFIFSMSCTFKIGGEGCAVVFVIYVIVDG